MNNPAAATVVLPKSIMILGAAKSGTTALFYAIQNTLKTRHGIAVKGLFEPTEARKIKEYVTLGSDQVGLVKMLLGPLTRKKGGFIERFEKKIIIFRDPRDNVISRLVFMLTKLIDPSQQATIDAVIDLLRRKERDPESLSVVQIVNEVGKLIGREKLLASVRNNALLPAQMKRESGGQYFMLSYEDFVESRFEGLNAYLGFEVDPEFEVGDRHTYVVRTKGAGGWKDWFLKEDVAYFATDVADDYAILGFDAGQQPNAVKTIDPKTASEYAIAQFTRVREKRRGRRDERRSKRQEEPAAVVSEPPVPVADPAKGKAAGEASAAADRKARQQRRKARKQAEREAAANGR